MRLWCLSVCAILFFFHIDVIMINSLHSVGHGCRYIYRAIVSTARLKLHSDDVVNNQRVLVTLATAHRNTLQTFTKYCLALFSFQAGRFLHSTCFSFLCLILLAALLLFFFFFFVCTLDSKIESFFFFRLV